MGSIRFVALIVLLLVTSAAHSQTPVGIDATTGASAEASWGRMLSEADSDTQSKLRVALLQLIGASGLGGLRLHTALEDPSVVVVKDQIAGLTAAQIIELGSQSSAGK